MKFEVKIEDMNLADLRALVNAFPEVMDAEHVAPVVECEQPEQPEQPVKAKRTRKAKVLPPETVVVPHILPTSAETFGNGIAVEVTEEPFVQVTEQPEPVMIEVVPGLPEVELDMTPLDDSFLTQQAPVEPVAVTQPVTPVEPVAVTQPVTPVEPVAVQLDDKAKYSFIVETIKTGLQNKTLDPSATIKLINNINTRFGTSYQGLTQIQDNPAVLDAVYSELNNA